MEGLSSGWGIHVGVGGTEGSGSPATLRGRVVSRPRPGGSGGSRAPFLECPSLGELDRHCVWELGCSSASLGVSQKGVSEQASSGATWALRRNLGSLAPDRALGPLGLRRAHCSPSVNCSWCPQTTPGLPVVTASSVASSAKSWAGSWPGFPWKLSSAGLRCMCGGSGHRVCALMGTAGPGNDPYCPLGCLPHPCVCGGPGRYLGGLPQDPTGVPPLSQAGPVSCIHSAPTSGALLVGGVDPGLAPQVGVWGASSAWTSCRLLLLRIS